MTKIEKKASDEVIRQKIRGDRRVMLWSRIGIFSLVAMFIGGPLNAPVAVNVVLGTIFIVTMLGAQIRADKLEEVLAKELGTWTPSPDWPIKTRIRVLLPLLIAAGCFLRCFATFVGGPDLPDVAYTALLIMTPVSFFWFLLEYSKAPKSIRQP